MVCAAHLLDRARCWLPRRLATPSLMLCLFIAPTLLQAASESVTTHRVGAPFLERENVREYIRSVSAEHGLNQHTIAGYFTEIEPQQGIVDAISRPAERVLEWRDYRPIFLGDKRIREGRDFLADHSAVLQRAEAQYGVPAEVITAIIGVETFYGRLTGRHGALESLATLAFDYPPRATFFRSELTEFLRLATAERWNPLDVRGSYAAAMGMPQFISSSYRAYSVDFDGDGTRDLFGSVEDAIGSVANYLARHGWREGLPIAARWSRPPKAASDLLRRSLKPSVHPETVRELGFEAHGDRHLSVMRMVGADGAETWVGYANFYSITRYNHSSMYALAVFQLSEAIGPLPKSTGNES